MFSPDVFEELATWLGTNQNSFPKYMEALMIGGTAEGKPVLRMAGNAHGYSDTSRRGVGHSGKLSGGEKSDFEAGEGSLWNRRNQGRLAPGAGWSLDQRAARKNNCRGARGVRKIPDARILYAWLHWGPVQKLKDMAYSVQGDIYMSPNAIYYDAADDERCAAWSAEVMSKLKPISHGSQMNDENMPVNKGRRISAKEASARLEKMRAIRSPASIRVIFDIAGDY